MTDLTQTMESSGNDNPAYKTDARSSDDLSHDAPNVPQICIEIEEDNVFDYEAEYDQPDRPDEVNSNYLSPPEKTEKQRCPSRSSSRLSSAISIISVASSQVSSRVDIDATRTLCIRSLGLMLAFLSGVLMTAYSSMIKMLDEMDSMQVVIMRGGLQMLVMFAVAAYKRLHFLGDKKKLTLIFLALVSITGGLRLLFIFTSFSRLPLGDSTTIIFSSPVLVMLFSICILKETCGFFRIGAGASLLTGVILIAKPPFIFGTGDGNYDFVGYILVCLACFMSALGIVLTKKISKKVEKTVILFYLGIAYVICGSVGLFTAGKPSIPALWEWGLASGISVLGVVQQYCLIYAVTLESPARVTIVRQMQIVLAYIVQIFMFDVMPMWTDMLGAALVLTTVIIITFEKQITQAKCCSSKDKLEAKSEKEKEAEKSSSVVEVKN